MARRLKSPSREKLTEEELAKLREQLLALPAYELESYYRAALNACRYEAGRLPSPRLMQELVQAWKALRPKR